VVPNRDHMRTVGDRLYKQTVLQFLSEQHTPAGGNDGDIYRV
jgi:hypothetical protein